MRPQSEHVERAVTPPEAPGKREGKRLGWAWKSRRAYAWRALLGAIGRAFTKLGTESHEALSVRGFNPRGIAAGLKKRPQYFTTACKCLPLLDADARCAA